MNSSSKWKPNHRRNHHYLHLISSNWKRQKKGNTSDKKMQKLILREGQLIPDLCQTNRKEQALQLQESQSKLRKWMRKALELRLIFRSESKRVPWTPANSFNRWPLIQQGTLRKSRCLGEDYRKWDKATVLACSCITKTKERQQVKHHWASWVRNQ